MGGAKNYDNLTKEYHHTTAPLRVANYEEIQQMSWKPVRNLQEHTYKYVKKGWLDHVIRNKKGVWGRNPELDCTLDEMHNMRREREAAAKNEREEKEQKKNEKKKDEEASEETKVDLNSGDAEDESESKQNSDDEEE